MEDYIGPYQTKCSEPPQFHQSQFLKVSLDQAGETEVRINQIADFLYAENAQIFQPRSFAGFFSQICYVDFVRLPARLPYIFLTYIQTRINKQLKTPVYCSKRFKVMFK